MLKTILLLIVATFAYVQCDKYTTKYDNINIDEILHTERLLKNYIRCLMEEGPCTPDGQELKKNMRDAIETDCEKCSEKQKEGCDKVIRFLIDNKPEMWKRLEEKYDPDGIYRTKYAERLNPTTPSSK